jgi:hypothetical protein
MCKRILFLLTMLWCAAAPHVAAQSALTVSATISSNVTSLARISLSSNTLAFPDADPDTIPQVSSSTGPLTITARARAPRNGLVTLTVQASDDLRSGVSVLPASLITWTATGPGYVNGALSRTTPQLVGSWTGSGVRVGTQDYRFQNSWNHAPGTYTVTLVYTLTSP